MVHVTLAKLEEKRKKKEEKERKLEPPPAPAPAPAPSPDPTPEGEPELFRDQETGEITGVTIDGKTFLGLSREEVERLVGGREKRLAPIEGAIEVGEAAERRRSEILASQVGQLTPEQLASIAGTGKTDLSKRQAGLAGVRGIVPSVLERAGQFAVIGGAGGAIAAGVPTAGAGAPAGAVVGGTGGALIGAGVGLIEGFYSAYTQNLQAQAKGEISASSKVLRKSDSNMRLIASAAWSGRGDKGTLVKNFNEREADVRAEWSKLTQDTSGDLNLFLSEDGTPILQAYEEFFEPSGTLELYTNEFQLALISRPDPERAAALLSIKDIDDFNAGEL